MLITNKSKLRGASPSFLFFFPWKTLRVNLSRNVCTHWWGMLCTHCTHWWGILCFFPWKTLRVNVSRNVCTHWWGMRDFVMNTNNGYRENYASPKKKNFKCKKKRCVTLLCDVIKLSEESLRDEQILMRSITNRFLSCSTVKVYKDNLTNEITSKTVLRWSAGETQKDFSGFWVKIFNGERPPKPMVTLHNKKLCIRQVIEGPENMAPIQNDQPHDGEKFGFKPFWLSVAGSYVLKYVAMLGDRALASTQFEIVVKG